jgi:NadR type nicotinamide-nucleotide adenylyltransferase
MDGVAKNLAAGESALARGRGLVLGKFLPPHRGHQFLIDFARGYCEHVTVLVCTLAREPIAGELRYRWMQEMFPFPNVRLVHVTEDLPQTPEEHPDFWNIWKRVIYRAAPEGVEFFFASEEYGHKTAEVIGGGCRYIEVDRPRELVPVSGTSVRSNPMKYWDFLPEPVRPHFLKRVCVFGPESTGKSTLARDLAKHFNTVYAWEYARPLLDPKGGRCDVEDIHRIARGQVATEDALARQANRVLICDTDVLTTTIWSEVLFGSVPAEVMSLAEERKYDLYLLLDVDVPWVDDSQRFFKEQDVRRAMFRRFKDALDKSARRYTVIRGGWDERFKQASDAVGALLSETPSACRL